MAIDGRVARQEGVTNRAAKEQKLPCRCPAFLFGEKWYEPAQQVSGVVVFLNPHDKFLSSGNGHLVVPHPRFSSTSLPTIDSPRYDLNSTPMLTPPGLTIVRSLRGHPAPAISNTILWPPSSNSFTPSMRDRVRSMEAGPPPQAALESGGNARGIARPPILNTASSIPSRRGKCWGW